MLVCEVAGFHLGSPCSELVHHILLEMTKSLSAAWHGQAGPGTRLPSVPHEGSEGPPTSCAKLWRYRAHRPDRIGAQLAFCTTRCVWRLQISGNLTCLQQATEHARRDLKWELCKSTSPQAPWGPQAGHLLAGGHPVPRGFASGSFHVAISTTESSSVLTGE